MAFISLNNLSLEAICASVPPQTGRVSDYDGVFGADATRKFTAMTGVKEFRRCPADQTASDLGFAAAERILFERKIDRSRIGVIIFVSQFPDYLRPATACVLQKRLNLSKDCIAFDVNLGCSSYVYGVSIMGSIMSTSDIDLGLLIVCDTASKTLPPEDPTTSMLFGDAGSATLMAKSPHGPGVTGLLRTIGAGYKAIIYPPGGFRNQTIPDTVFEWADGSRKPVNRSHMNGKAVFEFTITEVPELIREYLRRAEKTPADYDAVILHQANAFILKQLAKKFGLSDKQMPLSIDRFGNTSGVSLPLTLCDARDRWESEEVRVLFCGFGIGLSLGVVEMTIPRQAIFSVLETEETYPEGVIRTPSDLLIS